MATEDDGDLKFHEVRITLRLPLWVRDTLNSRASENGRSMNAEIVSRLERTIADETQFGDIHEFTGALDRRLDDVEYKIGILWDVYQGRDPYNRDK